MNFRDHSGVQAWKHLITEELINNYCSQYSKFSRGSFVTRTFGDDAVRDTFEIQICYFTLQIEAIIQINMKFNLLRLER